MAEKRPWWHEIVAGLSTERTPAPSAPTGTLEPRQLSQPAVSAGDIGVSRHTRSPGAVLRRRLSEWDPGSPAMEWVRRVTFDGRALAIRREQDAHSRRGSRGLGITPIVVRQASTPRAHSGPVSRLVLAPPFDRPLESQGATPSHTHPPPGLWPPPPAGGGPTSLAWPLPRGHLEPPCASPCLTARETAPTLAATPAAPSAPQHASQRLCAGPRHAAAALSPHDDAARVAQDVTICTISDSRPPSIPSLPASSGVHAPSTRRVGLSTAPAVSCTLPGAHEPLPPLRGKGAKHARMCAGPWASALAHMPPMPLTGAKRAQAGLADVPLASEDIAAVHRERAACALTSILPWAAAGFVLGDSPEMVASRPVAETTSRLIRALSAYGVSSTEAAYSALGRLLSWVIRHHPDALTVEGSHVSDFLAAEQPSTATLAALAWLRDHCGLAIPVRGPVCRPYRCRPPIAPHAKESLSIGAIVSLEFLAAHHPSEWVRGQAAGWSIISRLALRLEQAQACVINAFVQHAHGGESFTIAVGSVRRDKHPNPAKRRPRPIWGVIDGLDHPDCLRDSLRAMLSGVETSQFLLRDTDSPDGDPTRATAWISAPLKGNPRIDASLQALLRLPPASFSVEEASQIHGHAAKRFLLNVAEASAAFTPVEACEVGRFSMSTSQSPDLEPVAAMLHAHSLRASVLPDIYAGKAKVARIFDLLVKAHLALRSARRALAADPSLPGTGDASWGSSGPFAGERFVSPPRLLAHSS